MKEIKSYENMKLQEKWNMLAMVSDLYYNSDMTQNEIADRLFTSRSKISRMLKEARELGIVEITINEPWERDLDCEYDIMKKYHIKNVRVVVAKDSSEEYLTNRIADTAAYYIDSVIKRDMIIGISWGSTLHAIVTKIADNNRKNIPIMVVPIMGASNTLSPEIDSMDLAKTLAQAYGGKYQYVYAPLFVKDETLRDNLIKEKPVKEALDLAKQSDIILTSVGSVEFKSWEKYLSEQSFSLLTKKRAVGHIGGHFFDINGQQVETEIDHRRIGIEYTDLKKCQNVICIVHGAEKARALQGGLCTGIIDTLIIDNICAKALLS